MLVLNFPIERFYTISIYSYQSRKFQLKRILYAYEHKTIADIVQCSILVSGLAATNRRALQNYAYSCNFVLPTKFFCLPSIEKL